MQKSSERSSTNSVAPREPIAIIGMGCRFPGGATNPESFWQLLSNEVDAITEMPAGRFDIDAFYHPTPATPGRVVTRQGGFLEQIDQFDAAFFGISPREANCMDPQQRLLLEVVWEALEDGGQIPAKLAGSQTGVFIGMWTNDYEDKMYQQSHDIDLYITTGGGRYAASGRISYIFNFQGPSMTVDTACSSSLVAVHLACHSLWNGESDLALAGGVNLILEPQISIGYSRSKMLSPDARCKFGDARANGYVRSEGVGVVVLKPLSQALVDKDPIYALIRGSAVNNDGRSSELLVAPSPKTQIQMLRDAYRAAGVIPGQVSYVEAHGTGTRAGDPVELEALGTVLAEGRPADRPCRIGSVKTNIGHTEAASGIAGLIKAVLCLKHRTIPASLHFQEPNPAISWSDLPLVIQQKAGPWPVQEGPAFAGVNSFGVTGTNAHIVLQEPPAAPEKSGAFQPIESRAYLVPLSAHSPEALKQQAEDLLLAQKRSLQDLGYTLALRRAHHPYRLALITRELPELDDLLQNFLKGKTGPTISSGHPELDHPLKTVFVFPGQGSQWLGMGRELLVSEPVFRQTLEMCEQAMRPIVDWSLLEQLAAAETSANYRLNEIDVIQPTLLSIEIALATLWRAWGVEPDAVIGHSMGEVAAAYVAGALNLEDAMRVICRRSQLLRRTSGQGAMAVVGLSLDQAEAALDGYQDRLSVAVSNSPRSTVLSGDPAALGTILDQLKAQNIFCRAIKVDVASHSPQMEPLKEELLAALAGLQPQTGQVPIYSTALGEVSDGSTLDAAYWVRNLRQPVRFALMVQRLLEADHTIFIEMSPHPILLTAIEETAQHADRKVHPIASLRRDQPDHTAILSSFGQLYTLTGYPIDWQRLYPAEGQVVPLPPYPWQRRRFWLETGSMNGSSQWEWTARGDGSRDHPLLGRALPQLAHLPGSYFWQNRLNGRFRAQLSRYRLEEAAVLPDQVYAEMVLAAAAVAMGEKPFILSEFTSFTPLPLSLTDEPLLQVILNVEAEAASFKIYSRKEETEEWQPHAAGKIEPGQINPDWLYELEWQIQPPAALQPAEEGGSWLIFSDGSDRVGAALGALLTERGQSCTLVLPGEAYERLDTGIFKINPLQAGDFQRLLDEALTSPPSCRGIIHLWALTGRTQEMSLSLLQEAQAVQGGSVLHLVQSLAQRQGPQLPQLWLVTRKAQPVGAALDPTAVEQAALWGLGRTVALEHPDLWGGLIDLDDNPAEQSALALLPEILGPAVEDQVAFREGQRYVARLARQPSKATIEPVHFAADGTYLITGGLGGLGLTVAQWLVEQGVRHLALMGRRPPTAQTEALLQEMAQKGVQVVTLQADVAQPDQLERAMVDLDRQMPPLRGIIHAAGILDDGILSRQSWDRFARVLAPKVAGAWNLHRLSQSRPVDCFILFSSITSLLGSPGQGNYAAANAFLDGLAHARRAQGLPALTINWGVWAEVGLAMQQERAERMARRGLHALQPEEGLAALTYLCRQDVAQSAVSAIDWPLYLGQLPPGSKSRWLTAQAKGVDGSEPAGGAAQPVEILQQLNSARPEERYDILLNYVRSQVAVIMGFPADYPLEARQGFFQLGMDSLMTVELRNRLQATLPCTLSSTLAFDYPTIAILTEHLLTTLFPPEPPAPEAAAQPAEPLPALEKLSRDELKALLDQELASIDEGILG